MQKENYRKCLWSRPEQTRPDPPLSPLSFALYILLLVTAVHSQSSTAVVVITLECPLFTIYIHHAPFSQEESARPTYYSPRSKLFTHGSFQSTLIWGHTSTPMSLSQCASHSYKSRPSLLPIRGEFCSLDRSQPLPCSSLYPLITPVNLACDWWSACFRYMNSPNLQANSEWILDCNPWNQTRWISLKSRCAGGWSESNQQQLNNLEEKEDTFGHKNYEQDMMQGHPLLLYWSFLKNQSKHLPPISFHFFPPLNIDRTCSSWSWGPWHMNRV